MKPSKGRNGSEETSINNLYIIIPGTKPKEIRSANESNWPPNLLSKVTGMEQINVAANKLITGIETIQANMLPAIHSKTVFIANDIEEDLPESVDPDYT